MYASVHSDGTVKSAVCLMPLPLALKSAGTAVGLRLHIARLQRGSALFARRRPALVVLDAR